MQVGRHDTLSLPPPSEPFALIAGSVIPHLSPTDIETAIRHMGLRPERIGDGSVVVPLIDTPLFRLHFASFSILAGGASVKAIELADPIHCSTSQFGTSLPADWQVGGRCWIFVPENGDDAVDVQRARMREFFKTLILLIDLFNADHVFWSPARLWSDGLEFRASMAEMLVSGIPPAFHLVAFRRHEEQGLAWIQTRGLTLFGGQEIIAPIPPGWAVAETVRRIERLALDILLNGPISDGRRIPGLAAGEWMSLRLRKDMLSSRSVVQVEFEGEFG